MEATLKAPLILGIETSGKTGGLALFQEKLLIEITLQAQQSYSQILFHYLPLILEKTKVSMQDIQFIAVDIGPGSFTGLRIGISAIKAFSLVYNCPIIPISSLEVLAYPFYSSPFPILSLIDAYTQEIFIALYKYEGEFLKTLYPPNLVKLQDLGHLIQEPTLFVSETLEKWESHFKEKFREKFIKPLLKPSLRASLVCEIAWLKLNRGEAKLLHGEELLPLYLKPSEAERKR
ncbi:MAG: tRNA (adenosine(37)-N6)-threonylcarbamoyltransferase complex dimerization subunit type 1 TsaB [Caldimicrobium sp.]